MTLEGKVCFITGGGQGLGLGIAMACAVRGAKIALADIDEVALAAATDRLKEHATVVTYAVDVTDRAAMVAVADRVEADLGPVTAVFNNAGVIDSVSPSQMHGELWDWLIGINLTGVYNGVQAFIPRMIRRGDGGYLVNTSSGAGLVVAGSGFAYHAAKFAVVGLSESLRIELAHHKISVSVVCPGPVATGIVNNTRGARPADAEKHTKRVDDILDFAHQALQDQGVSIADAGEHVVAGMLAGRLHVFTDGDVGDLIVARTRSILEDLSAGFPDVQVASI